MDSDSFKKLDSLIANKVHGTGFIIRKADIKKGIEHSRAVLQSTIEYIEGQEDGAQLSDLELQELQDFISDLSGLVSYLERVKGQRFFEKEAD